MGRERALACEDVKMTDEYLNELLDGMSATELVRWYQQQILVARYLRSDLLKRTGIRVDKNTAPSQVPDAEEIVHETIIRIRDHHNERYVWDHIHPTTFNQFFG